MGKILQDIKNRLIAKKRYLELRLLWYRMGDAERLRWLQEAHYLLWCAKHGRKVSAWQD